MSSGPRCWHKIGHQRHMRRAGS